MKEISTVGLDIGKKVFTAYAAGAQGQRRYVRKLYRNEVLDFFRNSKPCTVALEACGGAHYWAREIEAIGHKVQLIAPQYVKPFVKRGKNDAVDAEAICEAVQRPTMRFVPIKSVQEQEIMQLHTVRQRLVRARTALVNEIKGMFGEYGYAVTVSHLKLRREVIEILGNCHDRIPTVARETFERLSLELLRVSEEIEFYQSKIEQIHKAHPIAQRLATIPGVGPLTATAMVAAVGEPGRFKNGRQFAAFLGLVPSQHTTGGVQRLGRISKQGNTYLRQLLILGAQPVVWRRTGKTDKLNVWLQSLVNRRGVCRAVIAQANKNARLIWALLKHGGEYKVNHCPTPHRPAA